MASAARLLIRAHSSTATWEHWAQLVLLHHDHSSLRTIVHILALGLFLGEHMSFIPAACLSAATEF